MWWSLKVGAGSIVEIVVGDTDAVGRTDVDVVEPDPDFALVAVRGNDCHVRPARVALRPKHRRLVVGRDDAVRTEEVALTTARVAVGVDMVDFVVRVVVDPELLGRCGFGRRDDGQSCGSAERKGNHCPNQRVLHFKEQNPTAGFHKPTVARLYLFSSIFSTCKNPRTFGLGVRYRW